MCIRDSLGYAQGLVPVVATSGYTGLAGSMGLLDLFGYALTFITFWYMFKLVVMIFSMIPFIGRHIPLPSSGESTIGGGSGTPTSKAMAYHESFKKVMSGRDKISRG